METSSPEKRIIFYSIIWILIIIGLWRDFGSLITQSIWSGDPVQYLAWTEDPIQEDYKFYSPSHILINTNGDIFVSESQNNILHKFDSSGKFLMKFGKYQSISADFNYPQGMTHDVQGNIYVTDFLNRVQKFDSSGNLLMKFGSMWNKKGQFNQPVDVALDSQWNIYVADRGNRNIQKFDPSGKFLMKIGKEGNGQQEYTYPSWVTVDAEDNIYVTDSGKWRVQKFDSSGKFLMQFDILWWSGAGEFAPGIDIVIDKRGDIYVSDILNWRIKKFNTLWVLISEFGNSWMVLWSIDLDDSNNIYAVDSINKRIQKFTPDMAHTIKNSPVPNQYDPSSEIPKKEPPLKYVLQFGSWIENSEFSFVDGVATDVEGNVYTAEWWWYTKRIQKFDPSGKFLMKFETEWYTNIAVDNRGYIYTAGLNNVHKFDPSGNSVTKFTTGDTEYGSTWYINGITVDELGNIYVAEALDYGRDGRVQKFDSSGNFLMKFGSKWIDSRDSLDGQFLKPNGIALDTSGNIYVVDKEIGRVQKFDPSGNFLMKFGHRYDYFPDIESIALDTSGNIYIVNRNHLLQFDPSGNLLMKFESDWYDDGEFSAMKGLAIDLSGNIYLTDRGSFRIEKFVLSEKKD